MAKNLQDLKHSEEEYFQKADNLIHNSCPILRSLFCRRWEQTTGSAWSGQSSAKELVTGIGKNFYHGTVPIQRELMKNRKLEEWDMSLLGNLLMQIDWWKPDDEESASRRENQAIEKLMQLRNEAAHNSIRKLNEFGYQKIEQAVRAQLEELGMSQSEIQGIVEKAVVITPVSGWAIAKKIVQKGNKKFQTGDYPRAIERYSEALQVPNLSANEKANLLEKRARARLSLAENMKPSSTERKTCLDEVKVDVNKSLEYNSDSWKAHEILGKIYKHEHNYSLACEQLRKALAISPAQSQTELKAELDHCKYTLGKVQRMDHLRNIPKTFQEGMEEFTKETGRSMTKETWLNKLGKDSKYSDVLKGHQYVNGWFVEQDYVEAAKHFAKADELGIDEGTVNLARLYLEGLGVEQSFPRAFELFNKAAIAGNADAQHNIASFYDDGVYVGKDYKTAAKWYKKAAINGNGLSANNLGVLLYAGNGVAQDKEKAVMYWRLGMRARDMNSARALCLHYLCDDVMEPQLARIVFERALELGNEDLQPLSKRISELEKWRESKEPALVALEEEHKMNDGMNCMTMTFAERYRRYCAFQENKTYETLKALQQSKPSKRYLEDPWRRIRILDFRTYFARATEIMSSKSKYKIQASITPDLEHKIPGYFNQLKSIKMIEINEGKEGIYEGRVLNLTLIEEPMIGLYTAVHTIAEDENGDVTRLAVFNVPHNAETAKLLGSGSRLSVINPYMRLAPKDLSPCIRVDDPKCIIYNDGIKDMCRYCGEENATRICSNCKKAKYCSKDCQEKDWTIFKHKLICFKSIENDCSKMLEDRKNTFNAVC